MEAVNITRISKSYEKGKVLALDDVSLQIPQGALFGLIGPDGAGKTSLFRILATLLQADKGEASLAGYDVVKDYRQIRNIIGYMPGKFSLYQDLSVAENLDFFATLFGTTIAANYDLIKDIYDQLKPFKDRRAGKLSGGMKQKLALCCALIHKPTVLLLDEPTTGVDVVSRREFWDMLGRLKAMGITILVSTPYMDEAILCDQIALIQKGRILSVDTPDAIIKAYPVPLYSVRSNDIYRLLTDLRTFPGTDTCYAFGADLHLTLKQNTTEERAQLDEFLARKNHKEVHVVPIQPGIEDSFIYLMNNNSKKEDGGTSNHM